MDQANRLRDIIRKRAEESISNVDKSPYSSRVITITSGKGGVGKTNVAVNLAIQMAKNGKRVVIVDADFGLANIEVLFGISPKYTFSDVVSGQMEIGDIITEGPMGIKFISGGSGFSNLRDISSIQMSKIFKGFSYLDTISDIIIIDTGAGISNTVIDFVKASRETIIITTPEPTSITDAYAIIKTIKEEVAEKPIFKIIVNRVESNDEGLEIYNKLSGVSAKFLDISIENLGYIPFDNALIKAVKLQQPLSISFPNSEATKAIEIIGMKLLNMDVNKHGSNGGLKSFMKRFVDIFNS